MSQKLIRTLSLIFAAALQGDLWGQTTSYYPLQTEPSWEETAVDRSFLDNDVTLATKTNLLGFDGAKYVLPIIPGFQGTWPIEIISQSDGGEFHDPFDTFNKLDNTVNENGIIQWKAISGSIDGGAGQGAAGIIFSETSVYSTLGIDDTRSDGVILTPRTATIGEVVLTRYFNEREGTSYAPDLDINQRTVGQSTVEHRSVYAGTAWVDGLFPGSDPLLATDPYLALVRVTETTLTGTTETFIIDNGVETSMGINSTGPSTITSIEWTVKGIGPVRFLFAFGAWLDPILENSIFNDGSNVVGAISLDELIPADDLITETLRASGGNLNDAADTILTGVGQEITLWPVPVEREIELLEDAITQLASAAEESGLSGDDQLPEAIPQNDGIPNILKFAFNMDLSNTDTHVLSSEGSSGLPAVAIVEAGSDPKIKIDYIRRKNAGLTYRPIYSTTISPQSFTTIAGPERITPIDETFERVSVQTSVDFTESNTYFGRVKVEY